MTEQECLSVLPAPGAKKANKWLQGVVQILVTSSCNLSCTHCTQFSQVRRKPWFMTPDQFEQAVLSLRGWTGVYGVFGGNPAVSPYFADYCEILKKHVPKSQSGLWCNHPMGKGSLMREVFSPAISNLNVHLDQDAYDEFCRDWPEARPFGLNQDSRHSPVFVSMKDVVHDESERWRLISTCDIAHYWSSGIGVFRGELRAWLCEVAMAQSIIKQDDVDYPDTGMPVTPGWWRLPTTSFAEQVRYHCHRCSVPLRGYGSLARDDKGVEQTSAEYADVCKPKKKDRQVQVVTSLEQLHYRGKKLDKFTDYLGNSSK